MALREKLHETPEYQATAGGPSGGQGSGQARTQSGQGSPQVPGEIAPIVSLEKGDIEFWLRVLTVILLWMIYQELRRNS
jgi:hypothetical protein